MNTKTLIALPIAFFTGIAMALLACTVIATTASAETKSTAKTDTKAATTITYAYTAQSGDSYSKLARKAIQTYGVKNKVAISQSRIIYAETNLTQEAGSPQITKGQKVTISEATVKGWVEKAKKLSDKDAAKWDKYTTNVNFDTRAVGQVK
jgi:hypothetical protein